MLVFKDYVCSIHMLSYIILQVYEYYSSCTVCYLVESVSTSIKFTVLVYELFLMSEYIYILYDAGNQTMFLIYFVAVYYCSSNLTP